MNPYAVLGAAIRSDRQRQGLKQRDLVDRVKRRGGEVSTRSISNLENGHAPESRDKRPTLEVVVAALGWRSGWTDRILGGESPAVVLAEREQERIAEPGSTAALQLLPQVYAFSRAAAGAGADPRLRDEFDALADRLLASIPSGGDYGLAAYRPHAAGEGPAFDDAARIARALDDDE